jgi:hypothetical protein
MCRCRLLRWCHKGFPQHLGPGRLGENIVLPGTAEAVQHGFIAILVEFEDRSTTNTPACGGAAAVIQSDNLRLPTTEANARRFQYNEWVLVR